MEFREVVTLEPIHESPLVAFGGGDYIANFKQGIGSWTPINNLESITWSQDFVNHNITGCMSFSVYNSDPFIHLGIDPYSPFTLIIAARSKTGHESSEVLIDIKAIEATRSRSCNDLGSTTNVTFTAASYLPFAPIVLAARITELEK